MISIIEDNRAKIEAICQQFDIRKLELFGSAATGRFDPQSSDLDFIVDLGDYEEGVSHRFLGFADALEALFGRSVDLITEPSIRNPYFRAEVDETRQPIYAAPDRKAVV